MRANSTIPALVLIASFALAGCDAPPSEPTPSTADIAAQTQTDVVTVPDAATGPAASTEPQQQVVMATAPPTAKDLRQILFANGSDALGADAMPELSKLARYMAKFHKSVVISGHSRTMGDAIAAKDLAERRVSAVRRYLIMHDVAASQIATVSYGDEKAAGTGATEAAQTQNDRVEFELVDGFSGAN